MINIYKYDNFEYFGTYFLDNKEKIYWIDYLDDKKQLVLNINNQYLKIIKL